MPPRHGKSLGISGLICQLRWIRTIFNTVSVLDYPVSLLESIVNESVVSHAIFMDDIAIPILVTSSFGQSRSNPPVHGSLHMRSSRSSRRYLTMAPLHQRTHPFAIEGYFR
jgi:hypothetical protein